jgi:membrane protein
VEELSVPRPGDSPAQSSRASEPAVKPRLRRLRWENVVQGYGVLLRTLHRTLLSVAAHDCLNVAQSTAYSAIVALFPALIVAAAVVGLFPDTAPVRFQLAAFFDRVLPPGVAPLLDAAVVSTPNHTHSVRALVGAGIVSFAGASNVIATLMEGLRRARDLPDYWGFWQRRRRTFELVPLSLAPLALASLLVVFGHAVSGWLASSLGPEVRAGIYVTALILRWVIALGSSVGVIALLYHLGVPDRPPGAVRGHRSWRLRIPVVGAEISSEISPLLTPPSWKTILPGAVMATVMWFVATLLFGWYVTRFANYSEVYGSLGAGIALLFWLYIISLCVLFGAEFNAQLDRQLQAQFGRAPAVLAPIPEPTDSSSRNTVA